MESGMGQELARPPKRRSAASWIFEFMEGNRGYFVASLLLALAGVACSLLVYLLVARLIGALMTGVRDMNLYTTICLQMAGLWVARYVMHSTSTLLSHKGNFQVNVQIRKRLLEKLTTMPLGIVKEKPSGSYKAILCERVESMHSTMAHVVPEFTANIAGAIVVFSYLMTVDWRMGLAALAGIPLGIVAFVLMMSSTQKYFPNTVEKTRQLNDVAVEYINGIEVIKAFGQSGSSYSRFVTAAREGADCFIDWMRHENFHQNFGMACFPATLLGVLPVGTILVMGGEISSADFVLCIILSFGVVTPLITAFSYTDDLNQIGVIVDEIAEILEQPDLVRPENPTAAPKNNRIQIRDVRFAYHDEEVLHGVNLDISPGSVNALVGPSGSGKSTIARLVASLWDVGSGSIEIGGVDIRTIPLSEYNQMVAYVSQENYLFDLSIKDNIRLGRSNASDEEVVAAAKACGCHEFIESLDNGYSTICGSSGGHLSGGERQRISIARAMLKDAPIVILDEATSYTDPESEAQVQAALAKLVRGKAVIVIAHRLSTITDVDRIFVIEDGNVVASGQHEELLKSCGQYRRMWESSMATREDVEGAVSC